MVGIKSGVWLCNICKYVVNVNMRVTKDCVFFIYCIVVQLNHVPMVIVSVHVLYVLRVTFLYLYNI